MHELDLSRRHFFGVVAGSIAVPLVLGRIVLSEPLIYTITPKPWASPLNDFVVVGQRTYDVFENLWHLDALQAQQLDKTAHEIALRKKNSVLRYPSNEYLRLEMQVFSHDEILRKLLEKKSS